MKTTITVELSQKSLENTKNLLKSYINNYEKGICDSVKMATEAMYNKVLQKCYENGIDNHTDAIHWDYDENTHTGRVWTNDYVLMFNEMGTGITGLYNPHPMLGNWKYDVNEHGEKGWWYPTDSPRGVLCSDGVVRAWTKGLPSRRMFYDAYCEIVDEIGEYVEVQLQKNIGNLYSKGSD